MYFEKQESITKNINFRQNSWFGGCSMVQSYIARAIYVIFNFCRNTTKISHTNLDSG